MTPDYDALCVKLDAQPQIHVNLRQVNRVPGFEYVNDEPSIHAQAAAAIRALLAEVERLRGLLQRTLDLAEFWILLVDRRAMNEDEYQTWHALGYGSSTFRDARAALAGDKP